MGERAQAEVAERVGHTPGPWEALPEKLHAGRHVAGRHPLVITSEGGAIVHVTRFALTGPCHIAEANARLIAAAPELEAFVAGITDCLGYAEWSTPAHAEEILRELIDRWHPKGRAAIAKAEGR